jgi:lactoylglutathione lyase
MDLMQFLWTTIQVSDLDRSLAFYQDLLGLPLLERFHGVGNEIAMLGETDGTHLELIVKEGAPLPAQPGQGLSLGFGPEDIGAVLAQLQGAGLTVSPPVSPNPTMKFYFVPDPDGYVIQLVEFI